MRIVIDVDDRTHSVSVRMHPQQEPLFVARILAEVVAAGLAQLEASTASRVVRPSTSLTEQIRNLFSREKRNSGQGGQHVVR